MDAIRKRLEEARERRMAGATAAELAMFAEAALVDPALGVEAAAGARGLLELACQQFQALESIVRGAYSRYPAVGSGAFHSGQPDPRSAALFRTLSHLSAAGLYTPADIALRLAENHVGGDWAAGESLRLALLVEALFALIRQLDAGTLAASSFGDAVLSLATTFGRMPIAVPDTGSLV